MTIKKVTAKEQKETFGNVDVRSVLSLFALIECNRPYDTGRDDRIKAITIQGV